METGKHNEISQQNGWRVVGSKKLQTW